VSVDRDPTERPIIFSYAMVRAIRDGRKTQTRRLVAAMSAKQREWLTQSLLNSVPSARVCEWPCGFGVALDHPSGGPLGFVRCPYGKPGARLWVRENWCPLNLNYKPAPRSEAASAEMFADGKIVPAYQADHIDSRGDAEPIPWRTSRFMPRWASRLTLAIVSIRAERLRDISETDARAEGCSWSDGNPGPFGLPTSLVVCARDEYRHAWDRINGKRVAWSANPWVWVVEFRKVDPS
jgi:hypothetical protein